jgi:putative redox protein
MENVLEKDITGHIGTQKYLCTITWRNNLLWTNLSVIEGKTLALILFYTPSLLAACTLSTLRMYIDRKDGIFLK